MAKTLLLLLLGLTFAVAKFAVAQTMRSFPPQGERGTLGQSQPLPQVQIGSRQMRLAPGAIIYDQQNRSIVHGQLPTEGDVFYTKDANGDVQRLYILTEQEKTQLDRTRRR